MLTIQGCLLTVPQLITSVDLVLYKNIIRTMKKYKKIGKFGEEVEGFSIPVLNEREIRAAAGILFLLIFISVINAIYNGSFVLLKYSVTFFLTDMIIRVFINPYFSPSLILGRLIVRRQTPEYTGAPQKKFAWTIGVAIASVMFILLNIVNSYSPITGILCFVCLIFLFFETAFGICIGCIAWSWFYKEQTKYCPGESCEIKKDEIRKTSLAQTLVLVAFFAYIFLTVTLFRDDYNKKPEALFHTASSVQAK